MEFKRFFLYQQTQGSLGHTRWSRISRDVYETTSNSGSDRLVIRLVYVDTSLAFSLAVSTGISFTLSEPLFSDLCIGGFLVDKFLSHKSGRGRMHEKHLALLLLYCNKSVKGLVFSLLSLAVTLPCKTSCYT